MTIIGRILKPIRQMGIDSARIEKALGSENPPKLPGRKGNGTVKEAPPCPAELTPGTVDAGVGCPYKVDK